MAATARVIKNVGVRAYLSGATLIRDPDRRRIHLDCRGATPGCSQHLERRKRHPCRPFISGCDLGIPSHTPLSITDNETSCPGSKLEFQAGSMNDTVNAQTLFCQMLTGGQTASITFPFTNCVAPNDINGPVEIWVTSDSQPLIGNVRDRATTQVVVGPALVFIDSKAEALGALLRVNGTNGPAVAGGGEQSSPATTTASPVDASQMKQMDMMSPTIIAETTAQPDTSAISPPCRR